MNSESQMLTKFHILEKKPIDLVFDLHNTTDGLAYWAHFGTVSVLYPDFILYTDVSYYIDWIKEKIN